MKNSNKILFVSNTYPKFRMLFPIAELLKKQGESEVVFCFDESIFPIGAELDTCRKSGIPFFLYSEVKESLESAQSSNPSSVWKKFKQRVIIQLQKFFPLIRKWNWYKNNLSVCRQFLLTHKISNLVVADDNHGLNLLFVKTAIKLGMHTILVPFTISNEEEVLIGMSRIDEMKIQSVWKKLFYVFFSKWTKWFGNQAVACLGPSDIICQTFLGMDPLNPWVCVGGRTESILMESQFMADYYEKNEVNPSRFKITGSIPLDIMAHRISKIDETKGLIWKKYNLKPGIPLILCALPPDFYPNSSFQTYEEMIQYMVDGLQPKKYNVLISLHPRIQADKVDFLKVSGAHIIDEKVEELIPLCDLYVACISATIRLALACRKKILNFDVFHYNFSEYLNEHSVVTVFDKVTYESSFCRLISEVESKTSINNGNQGEKANYYGRLDGLCGKRILEVIN